MDLQRAKYCWIAGDFLVLGHLANLPERVQWSGLNDIEWWTVGQRGSDYQTFPDGGAIQGGITDRLGAFIFQRSAIRYMQFDPSTGYTYTFTAANPSRGVVAPLSIVAIGPQDFVYLSEDGFFAAPRGLRSAPSAWTAGSWTANSISVTLPSCRALPIRSRS